MTDTLLADDVDHIPAAPENFLSELVGEEKKFKSPEDLARGKWESDKYIKVLETRLDEMRNDFLAVKKDSETKANLEALIDRLESNKTNTTQQTQANVEQRPVIDPSELRSLVSAEMQLQTVAQQQQKNFDLVRSKLQERYGENFNSSVKQQIDTLGITQARLDEMARTEPMVLIKALGLDGPAQSRGYEPPVRSSQRSDNFAPTANAKRTWSYYQKLKQTDPKSYYDPKTNVAMHNDMMTLGKEFEDGNWDALGN